MADAFFDSPALRTRSNRFGFSLIQRAGQQRQNAEVKLLLMLTVPESEGPCIAFSAPQLSEISK